MSILLNEIERGRHIGERVVLCDAEQRLAKYVAKRKQAECDEAGVLDRRISNRDIHLEGFGAELALAKVFNIYPDMTTHVRSVSTDTDRGDLILPCGLTVDVKASPTPTLIVFVHKVTTPTSIYCLMCGTFPEYTFYGFITKGTLFSEQNIADLGRGPRYVAESSDLKELVDLVDVAVKEVQERKEFEEMLFG